MVHPKKSANRGHVGWGYSFLDGSVMAPTPFVISPPTNGGCQSLLAAYWDCNPSVVWCIISSKRTHLQWEEWCCDVLWYCLWHPLQWVSSHLLTFVHNFLGTLWGAAPSLLPIMAAIPPPRETPVSTISKPSSLLFACNQMAWYPCGISWPTKNEANSILARSIPPPKKKLPKNLSNVSETNHTHPNILHVFPSPEEKSSPLSTNPNSLSLQFLDLIHDGLPWCWQAQQQPHIQRQHLVDEAARDGTTEG